MQKIAAMSDREESYHEDSDDDALSMGDDSPERDAGTDSATEAVRASLWRLGCSSSPPACLQSCGCMGLARSCIAPEA